MSWDIVKLGDLVEVLDTLRKPITKRNRVAGEYPYYGATGIVDWVNDYIFEEELVLIGEDGAKWESGEKTAFIVNGKYWVNNHAHVVNPDENKLLNSWLVYYLYFIDLKPWVTGLTVLKLNQANLKSIPIPVPPLPVQKQIVEKLDAAFANIDKAISATQKNIENAEALFQQSLNSFFNQKYNKEYSLGDVCEFIGGSQPPKSEFEKAKTKENIRLIQIRDYKSDKNIVYIPKELAKRHCTYDDVMIGRYGPPVFQILRGLEGSYNVALMKAVPNSDFLTKDYLFYFLKNPKIQNYIILLSKRAAGQSGLNKKTIEPYLIYLPSLEEQESIVFRTKSIEEFALKLTTINQKKLSMLNSLKTSFLNKAFSGELTKDAA